jgi:hypothetical protein
MNVEDETNISQFYKFNRYKLRVDNYGIYR